MAQYYIECVDEKGHRLQVPFWKIPALVEASVKAQKGVFAVEAEENAKKEKLEAELAAVRVNASLADKVGVDNPFDITAPVDFK